VVVVVVGGAFVFFGGGRDVGWVTAGSMCDAICIGWGLVAVHLASWGN
jgi:hypothetical protein